MIQQANGNFDTPMLFAGLIIMSLLGVVLFALVELLEDFVLPWHASRRGRIDADDDQPTRRGTYRP